MRTEEKIKQAFDPYFNVPLEAWKSFTNLGEIITTEKDEILKSTGTTEKYLSFILKGSGGILLWNNNNFVCIDLCYEGEFFGDYMSFLNQQPTPLEVVTFEPSELFRISKTNFNKLSNNTEFGDKICRFASEALFVHKQQQQIDILTQTATERYVYLQTKHPKIIQRTPQKYIASYLGVTPQSLSRIRKEQTTKH
ncbi:Crp/Fnr family transcriptional regulator [Mariniphaga sediminis]|uniref:Crp/Fnr family transcriptional regulator n=1 Tax=Mariniphaga sediminis TaxID=1628158 RepID=A0A399CSK2_9BACT|nr:Crp/Fnr family transcriptional regulator [Mariniphaga sediminis]RIH62869.1 Crp/Fnr family transcriptional regulator [Mariniphaga sediminis]